MRTVRLTTEYQAVSLPVILIIPYLFRNGHDELVKLDGADIRHNCDGYACPGVYILKKRLIKECVIKIDLEYYSYLCSDRRVYENGNVESFGAV